MDSAQDKAVWFLNRVLIDWSICNGKKLKGGIMDSEEFEIQLDRLCAEMRIEKDSDEYFQALRVLEEEIVARKINGVEDEISEIVDVMLSWRGREELSCERKELLEEISKIVSINRTAYVWMILREVLNGDYGENKNE